MEKETRKAVALKYDVESDNAPRIIAKGRGFVAEKIKEIAEEAGVPLFNDPDLVEVLSAVNLGDEVPPTLYQAVAEVLSFIYSLNRKGVA